MAGRREFLKLISAAMGSAILTACGGTGGGSTGSGGPAAPGGGSSSTPNAFTVSSVIGSGSSLPGGVTVDDNQVAGPPVISPQRRGRAQAARTVQSPFTGHAWWDGNDRIVFVARDNRGRLGLYRSDVSGGAVPQLSNTVLVVREGETLGGATVEKFSTCDVNPVTGTVVFHVTGSDGRESIYAYRGGTTDLVVASRQRLPGVLLQGRTTTSLPAYVGCHGADDDMLMLLQLSGVKRLRRTDRCLVYFPGGRAEDARVLLSTGDVLPDTASAIIRHMAALSMHENGSFVLMGVATPTGYAPRPVSPPAATTNPRPTFVLSGRVTGSDAPVWRLHSSSETLDVLAARRNDGAYRSARHINVPRAGPDGSIAYLMHDVETNRVSLIVDGRQVLVADPDGSGSLSPQGFPILGMRSPCYLPDGGLLLYARTTDSTELLVHRDGDTRTVLASGDEIGGRTVRGINLGVSPRMVSSGSRFCCRVRFSDDVTALVIGTPV